MRGVFSNANDIYLLLMILPRMSLQANTEDTMLLAGWEVPIVNQSGCEPLNLEKKL